MFTNPEALQTLYHWDFMEASSPRCDLSLTPFLVSLPSLGNGGEAKISKLLIMAWRPGDLIAGATQEFTQNTRHSCHPGYYKDFRSGVSRSRVKDLTVEQKMLLELLSLRKL